MPPHGALLSRVRTWLFVLAVGISTSTASAQTSRDHHFHSLSIYQPSGVPTYYAALYLSEPREILSEQEGFALATGMSFKVLRPRLSSKLWGRELIQNAVINNDGKPALLAGRENAFKALFDALTSRFYQDDIIDIRVVDGGIRLSLNNVALVYIEDEAIFEVLLGAWLGDIPPSSEFKAELLGKPASEESVTSFLKQAVREDRVTRAKVWAATLNPAEEVLAEPVNAGPDAQQVIAGTPMSDVDNVSAENARAFEQERRLAEKEAELAALQATLDEERLLREKEELERASQQRLADYTNQLFRHPNKFVEYPLRSLAKREQGLVEVDVQINRDGEVLSAALKESSNYRRLDTAALEAIERASPFPGVPEGIVGESFQFTVPVTFRMQ